MHLAKHYKVLLKILFGIGVFYLLNTSCANYSAVKINQRFSSSLPYKFKSRIPKMDSVLTGILEDFEQFDTVIMMELVGIEYPVGHVLAFNNTKSFWKYYSLYDDKVIEVDTMNNRFSCCEYYYSESWNFRDFDRKNAVPHSSGIVTYQIYFTEIIKSILTNKIRSYSTHRIDCPIKSNCSYYFKRQQ